MATLTVGSGKQFATVSSAIAASANGDTIQVQAGTYVNDSAVINTNISIVGVGGMVNLVCTEPIANGKAIFVTNSDVTLTNIAFSGAQVADDNGAGIRQQAGNLTINNCYFHDNQEGLLAGASAAATLTITNSEFADNGFGDGQTHNIYVGAIASLVITDSYFFGAIVGHEIKSRALNTTIENNVIADGLNGTASYSIDLPNGGNAIVKNNIIEKGPNSQNPTIIEFGASGSVYAGSNLSVTGNLILNDMPSPGVSAVRNYTATTDAITGNKFYGLTATQIATGAGPNTQSGNSFLTTEPYPVTYWTEALPQPWVGYTPAAGISARAAQDFNGDGKSDILWRNSNGLVDIWMMNGASGVTDNRVDNAATSWSVAGIGDFNGDGKADILWRNTSGSVDLWTMNGATVTADNGLGNVPTSWSVAGVGDFNGDGKADILWRNGNGLVDIWTMNGPTVAADSGLGNVATGWSVAGIGDFNGDGKADILWRDTSGNVDLWTMNGASVASDKSLGNVPASWSVAGIGDFNGDGKADILWRNSNGLVDIWMMNGANGLIDNRVDNVATSWSVASVGDFNGDGKADILWRSTGGNVDLWTMNGATVAADNSLGTVPTSWTIQKPSLAGS